MVGDPGLRSRLLREFAEQARAQAVVLHGRCPPYGEASTAVVVGQLLAQAAAVAPGDVPGGLADPAALSTDPRKVFGGLRLLFETLAAERPVIVIVDDLHWAEPDLLDLLDYINAFASGVGLLLLVAARRQLLDSLPCRSGGPTLELRPLPGAQAGELAVSLARPAGLDAGTARQIAVWAEGNPLFVEEQVRHLVAEDLPHRSGDDLPVPPAVEALVVAELERLPTDERTVIELASVVGRSFDWPAVAALAPDRLRSRVGALLLALARRGVSGSPTRVTARTASCSATGCCGMRPTRPCPSRNERSCTPGRRAAGRARCPCSRRGGRAVGHHLGQAYRYLAQLAGDEPPPFAPAVQLGRRPRSGGDRMSVTAREARSARRDTVLAPTPLARKASMGATFDERRLAREAAMGDQRAWDGLVDRFGELVWSTARAWGLNPEQGADAVQVTWLAGRAVRPPGQPRASGCGWRSRPGARACACSAPPRDPARTRCTVGPTSRDRSGGIGSGRVAVAAGPRAARALPADVADPRDHAATQPRGGGGRARPSPGQRRRPAGRLPSGLSRPNGQDQYHQGAAERLLR